jgi:hypothetical protein
VAPESVAGRCILPASFPGPCRMELLLVTMRGQVTYTIVSAGSYAAFRRELDAGDLGEVRVLSLETANVR